MRDWAPLRKVVSPMHPYGIGIGINEENSYSLVCILPCSGEDNLRIFEYDQMTNLKIGIFCSVQIDHPPSLLID